MAYVNLVTPEPAPSAAASATGGSLFRGALGAAAVLLLVGALAWLVFGVATGGFIDTDAKRVLERNKILQDRNTEDAKLLHDPVSWQAKDKGIVRVPIDRAIDFAMADLQKVSPHPAYPLKQSPPQPANAPAAGSAATAAPGASAPGSSPSASPAPGAANPPTPVSAPAAPAAAAQPAPAANPPVQPASAATPLAIAPGAADAPTPSPVLGAPVPAGTP